MFPTDHHVLMFSNKLSVSIIIHCYLVDYQRVVIMIFCPNHPLHSLRSAGPSDIRALSGIHQGDWHVKDGKRIATFSQVCIYFIYAAIYLPILPAIYRLQQRHPRHLFPRSCLRTPRPSAPPPPKIPHYPTALGVGFGSLDNGATRGVRSRPCTGQ